jgi:hypothetical protein
MLDPYSCGKCVAHPKNKRLLPNHQKNNDYILIIELNN